MTKLKERSVKAVVTMRSPTCESDSHGNIRIYVSGLCIEILAKLHHIDTKRAESLSHFRVRLGNSCHANEIDLGFH